jgi:hypothetical protein
MIFERGYVDDNNQYRPKKPNYRLKDKQGHLAPNQLDTANIYRLKKSFFRGRKSYPLKNPDSPLFDVSVFIKFYSKGRCLFFSKKGDQLHEADLNPNNSFYNKEYFYSEGGNRILIEGFIYGEGRGHYDELEYYINTRGDSLIMTNDRIKKIYVLEEIPKTWNKYKVDW